MTAEDHGEPSTYTNWGCHCDACKAAVRRDRKRRELQRIERNRKDDA